MSIIDSKMFHRERFLFLKGNFDIFNKSEQDSTAFSKDRIKKVRKNMPGLLAILEDEKANLVGRRETRFSSVPLTGVQLEVFMAFIGCCF